MTELLHSQEKCAPAKTSFKPDGRTRDGKPMYRVVPGPQRLLEFEEIEAINHAASCTTPRQQPPTVYDKWGRAWSPGPPTRPTQLEIEQQYSKELQEYYGEI